MQKKRKFWSFLEAIQKSEGIHDCPWQLSSTSMDAAVSMIRDGVANADRWINRTRKERDLTFYLLCALRYGGVTVESPKAFAYELEDVTIYSEREDFINLLYRSTERGAIFFLWFLTGDDYFMQLSRVGTYLSFLTGGQDSLITEGQLDYEGAAIGIIRGHKVDVYPLPDDWPDVVNFVRKERRKMTSKQKAAIELPGELKAFVELLGWEAVNNELQKIST